MTKIVLGLNAADRKMVVAMDVHSAFWHPTSPWEEAHHGFCIRADAPGVVISFRAKGPDGKPVSCDTYGCPCPSSPSEGAGIAELFS